MKTYISDIIPRISKFSKQLDDLTTLTDQHWVAFDQLNSIKRVFIFRRNLELLISSNGEITKGKWEFIEPQSILLEFEGSAFLFKLGFFDENILALKIDGTAEYAFFVNQSKYEKEMTNIGVINTFLSSKYEKPIVRKPKIKKIKTTKLKRTPLPEWKNFPPLYIFIALGIILLVLLLFELL